MSTAVSETRGSETDREGEGEGETEKDVMWLTRSVSVLSLRSSLFFSIQLSSKALYWHDCPKLTIQLEGFTLQSLSCCVSLCLSLEISSAPLLSPCVCLPFPFMCLTLTVSSLFPHPSSSSFSFSLVLNGRSSFLCLQAQGKHSIPVYL